MENMLFGICDSCGGYILPGAEVVKTIGDETIVLCHDCADIKGTTEAAYFAKKYNLQ